MDPKENFLRILRCDHPERIVSGPPEHAVGYFGCNHEGYAGGGHNSPVGTRWLDIWQVGWQKEQAGVMAFPRQHPLADLPHALRNYSWPNPNDQRLISQIDRQASGWNAETTFLSGSHRDTLWEKCYMLVGMEDLMCYFRTEPGAVRDLLHHVMDFHLGIARHYLAAGVEIVNLSDDLGTQNGRLFSPQILESFFLPEYERLFSLYRERHVLINFHSCGHILPLVDTFVHLGVDILNPVQATANDLPELRRRTQGRIALQGGVRSAVLVEGPAAAIRGEVRARILQLGQNGGYFCAPDQGMPWPLEHYEAFTQALDEYGQYPLSFTGDQPENG
jgi:uroporphyrinogen decarboxylase